MVATNALQFIEVIHTDRVFPCGGRLGDPPIMALSSSITALSPPQKFPENNSLFLKIPPPLVNLQQKTLTETQCGQSAFDASNFISDYYSMKLSLTGATDAIQFLIYNIPGDQIHVTGLLPFKSLSNLKAETFFWEGILKQLFARLLAKLIRNRAAADQITA